MSGRNNRVVRNRERSSNFSGESKTLKIMLSVIFVILVIMIVLTIIWKMNHKNQKRNMAEWEEKISYEYFMLSTENGVGIIDKNGKSIIEAKYTRNRYAESFQRRVYCL